MFTPTNEELIDLGFLQKGDSLHYTLQHKGDFISYCDGEFFLYLEEIYQSISLYPESISELQTLIKTLNPR